MKGDLTRPCIVYMVTNVVNGKRYIGVTTATLRHRMAEHFSHGKARRNNGAFYRAIQKYGRDVFVGQVLMECQTAVVALEEEKRLIALVKPEYNSTPGGEARGNLSEEGRAKIIARHKGNKYHLGKKHSWETKEYLRELAKKNLPKFAPFMGLGPKKQARKVICLDDGRMFESASAAARNYSVHKSAVIEMCLGKRNKKMVGGLRFKYLEPSAEAA